MIREGGNSFTPGSVIPPQAKHPLIKKQVLDQGQKQLLQAYIETKQYAEGANVLVLGAPKSGKTIAGLQVLHAASGEVPVNYWTEADFLADQRNLWRMEDLSGKVTRDDGLWHEYLEWEAVYNDFRETPLLFLDDVGMGYSPHHRYELERLLRQRESLGHGTVVGAQTERWSDLPKGLRKSFEDRCIVLTPRMEA